MRLAVYTTAYPAVERFLPDWYRSVASQEDSDFDLWVGLDGLTERGFCDAAGATLRARWVHGVSGESPAAIRAKAIRQMVAEYDGVVFVDSDDILCPSRVRAARQWLENWDVVACSLAIIDESGRDLGLVFGPANGDNVLAQLPRYNVFGLSNTAYRSSILARCLPIPAECTLVDWLLATRAWSTNAALGFDAAPRMKYRQYGSNTAAVLGPYTPPQIARASDLVLGHYRCILDSGWKLPTVCREALAAERERVAGFHSGISGSREILERYVDALNEMPRQYLWWWGVAHPALKYLWNK